MLSPSSHSPVLWERSSPRLFVWFHATACCKSPKTLVSLPFPSNCCGHPELPVAFPPPFARLGLGLAARTRVGADGSISTSARLLPLLGDLPRPPLAANCRTTDLIMAAGTLLGAEHLSVGHKQT